MTNLLPPSGNYKELISYRKADDLSDHIFFSAADISKKATARSTR